MDGREKAGDRARPPPPIPEVETDLLPVKNVGRSTSVVSSGCRGRDRLMGAVVCSKDDEEDEDEDEVEDEA